MARYRGPKNRIARRFGANIFGTARNPLLHKPNPPGMHGARRRKKSDYGLQLEEKQKLKASYGMLSEKQLVKYYKEAFRRHGSTVDHLLVQLECRLDNIVYRLKLAPTIFAAHQLVSHGHILVDGKKVDRRSFQVRPGMTISVRERSRKVALVSNSVENASRSVPAYLEFDPANFCGKLVAAPTHDEISLPIEINVSEVCDFLTHTT
jgi:small subunit ribosomal protein S4